MRYSTLHGAGKGDLCDCRDGAAMNVGSGGVTLAKLKR